MAKISMLKNPYAWLIAIIVLVAIVYSLTVPKPVKRLDIYNTTFFFRADINEASKVNAYPNEQVIYEKLNNPNLNKIIILFNENQSALAALEGMEITYKLTYHYLATQKRRIKFDAKLLPYNATDDSKTLYIYFNQTNNVSVVLKDNKVFINYNDKNTADLATIKFILTVFGLFEK